MVAKGEIFDKQGRTGAWYYIKINDDTFGWISGRAISRYQADEEDEAGEAVEAPSTYVETREAPIDRGYDPYYPYYPGYYPGYYYDYPFYSWGLPYYSSEYYYYGNHHYPRRSWEHEGGSSRTWNNRQYRSDSWQRDGGSNRNYNVGPRVVPAPRLPGPRPRMSIPRARPSSPRHRR